MNKSAVRMLRRRYIQVVMVVSATVALVTSIDVWPQDPAGERSLRLTVDLGERGIATNSVGNSASSSASNAVTPASLVELASGVAVSGLSGAEGSDQYFFIDV
ncbi:MAG: hypothetical protein P8M13_02205, partial [Luminiphilus sp.]|nr:hypothetical protein [Luminiphilus sp.]